MLCICVVRNEMMRLPHFLDHYRALGLRRFLFVDNGSHDGTPEFLTDQPDVVLWQTAASYRDARFGLDWAMWLLLRYGHGKWCLTVDADELLVFAGMERGLAALTQKLETRGQLAFGALMLELYPRGRVSEARVPTGANPLDVLQYFDAAPYRAVRQQPKDNLWVQGGVRERVFFSHNPQRGPTLNKLPLVKWDRRFAYSNSTHAMLPPPLNHLYDGPGDARPCGALLHTKFLADAVARAREDIERRQHFSDPDRMRAYNEALASDPILFGDTSTRYTGWRQLVDLGLMSDG